MPANNLVEQNTANDLSVVQFAKRSFLLISSSIARLATQLVIIFLYSRHLSMAEYGLYQSVWLYINILSIVSLFGLPALLLSVSIAAIRVWIQKNKQRFVLYATALNIIPLVYILFAANEYSATTKILLVVLSVAQNIAILVETLLIKNKKEGFVFGSNLIFFTGYLACHLLVLYNSYSLDKLLYGITGLFIVKLLFLAPFCKQHIFNQANGDSIPVGRQWFYLGINDILAVIFKWLDKWIILLFISLTQFALYFNGSYEIPIFGLMLSAVGNIMLVDLSGQKNITGKKVQLLFKNSALLLAGIVFPSFCFLLFYNREIFTLLFSEKYIEALPVFIVSIFVLPLRITNFTAVLQVYHRNDLVVKGAVLDLLIAVLLMTLLYPLFQLRGFAAAFVISSYIQAAYYLWHTGKLVNEKITRLFPFKKLLLILIPAIVITGAGFYGCRSLTAPFPLAVGIVVCAILISIFFVWHYKRNKPDSN